MSENENNDNEPNIVDVNDLNEQHSVPSLDIYDPKTWDNLDNKTRDLLVEKRPIKETIVNFPLDGNSRHFSHSHYTRILPNGENQDRKWLVYSKSVDKVYCFCCKLFKSTPLTSALANERYNDWKHLSEMLKLYENNIQHITNMNTWIDLQIRLRKNETIDKNIQKQIFKEKIHWKQVLLRIIAIVKCLAKNSISFHEIHERICEDNNSNFFGFN